MTATRERIHTYFVIKEPGVPDRVLVWDTPEISVGRASDNDLAVDHAEMSRKHACFVRTAQGHAVQNLSTSNDTNVNGRPIKEHPLQNREVVEIAGVEMAFYQHADNPAGLGLKVQYSSQLKDFGPAGAIGDGESTVLGLVEELPGGDDDAFEIQRDDSDLRAADEAPAARNLDLELEDFGLDDPPTVQSPAPKPKQAAPAPRRSAPTVEPQEEAWTLDDSPATRRRLSLYVELDGLSPELHQALHSLMGKIIDLRGLRLRIKPDGF